jgi:hypothetical protein
MLVCSYAELVSTHSANCQLAALYVWSLISSTTGLPFIDQSLCDSLASLLVQIESNSPSSTESKLFSSAVTDVGVESQQLEPLQDTITRIELLLGGVSESTSKSVKKPAKSAKSTKKVEQVDSCCDIVLLPHQSSWQTLISMLQIADQFAFKMNTQFQVRSSFYNSFTFIVSLTLYCCQLLALRSSLNLARQQFQNAELDRDDYVRLMFVFRPECSFLMMFHFAYIFNVNFQVLFVAFVSEKCANALVLCGLHRFAIPFILHSQRLFELFGSVSASNSLSLAYGRVCTASTMIEIVTRLDNAADQLSRFQASVECLQTVIDELTAIPKLYCLDFVISFFLRHFIQFDFSQDA